MDPEINECRSLPPLVEGKLHGYLKLTLDEVVWSRRSPGDVTILASWWGELDSAQFRPIDLREGSVRLDRELSETYVVRTSYDLLKEYLQNCETIDLVVVSERTRQVIGTGHVPDLPDILEEKSYSRYIPIRNDCGNRLGDVRVRMKFTSMTKNGKSTSRTCEVQRARFNDRSLYLETDNKWKHGEEKLQRLNKLVFDDKLSDLTRNEDKYEDNGYRSILKDKRMKTDVPFAKFDTDVTDKLIAQVVARAQRLRGAILKETYNEDPLALSESSGLDDSTSDNFADDEAKLYEYFLGNRMTRTDESRALDTLRTVSPSPSLINLASETIRSYHNYKSQPNRDKNYADELDSPDDYTGKETLSSKAKESSTLDQIDSIKIVVDSLALSPAGYRRVRSSCISRGDNVPLSATYLVEYNASFAGVKKSLKKITEERPTRVCSKKQIGQVIYFNHQAVFDLPKCCIHSNTPLKFKVFNRYLNQRTPTLLGFGSIHVYEVAETETLSTTQKLVIVNKGIKMGELKVNIELGCDGIHFGKDYVEAITATKQNIPVYDISPTNSTVNSKIKSATGSNSKPNSRVSSASKYSQYSCTGTNAGTTNRDGGNQRGQLRDEDRYVRSEQPRGTNEDKILLHGLIYVAEGKGLPRSNTFLICRAFWRGDRATSQLCTNTENPVYHFHELVPLLHGQDLLDRTKDNFVIIEVWSRNSAGQDSLIGITKLSVHQLYVAYRDPMVVPHLLLSKYPVISVDGWVPISEPVTGDFRGELLALVALGTADQISFLETTRGLRSTAPRATSVPRDAPRPISNSYEAPQNRGHFSSEQSRSEERLEGGSYPGATHSFKTQESQTEITTLKRPEEDPVESVPQTSVLHALVDHLAQSLTVPKSTAQGPPRSLDDRKADEPRDPEPPSSTSSTESSPRDNFHVPTGMYRSVGVGAEFAEPPPPTTYANSASDLPTKLNSSARRASFDALSARSDAEESSFRAHVEIECALHLPKVEFDDGVAEPSSYVTFQPVQREHGSQYGPHKVTNIFPHSCSPKWEWRCDTRLSSDLLVNDQKRMILKIWRLADPMTSGTINLDKDIVIGFAAVDLSILLAGFPLVSGWFHIMDFTGKCNGQIKVTVTPLENISSFVKSTSSTSVLPNSMSNVTTCYPAQSSRPLPRTLSAPIEDSQQRELPVAAGGFSGTRNQFDNNDVIDMGLGFSDVSMTLSQSLKQKLTELDEITKRLRSRLHDVTNEDFELDFDPEFDPNDPDPELEAAENGNASSFVPQSWQSLPPATNNSSSGHSLHSNRYLDSNPSNDVPSRYASCNFDSTDRNMTETGYSSNSRTQSLSNGHLESDNHNGRSMDNGYVDQPARGARTHINHLLDKLNLLTSGPPPAGNFPIKRNIHDFIASLRPAADPSQAPDFPRMNNFPDTRNHTNGQHSTKDQNPPISNGKCNQEIIARSVRTQTEEITGHSGTRDVNENDNVAPTNPRNKVSTLIREELVAEESNEANEIDELTTHLLSSNVRHMDLNSILNPLLYQHLIPDVRVQVEGSVIASTEDLANLNAASMIEDLDNRYAETFNATVNDGLGRLRDVAEMGEEGSTRTAYLARYLANEADLFENTPTELSENVDGNIDVTIVRNASNDNLMASNGTESSIDTSSSRQPLLVSEGSSVSVVTRQAPDGGNPVEETNKTSLASRRVDSSGSSTDS